MKKAEGNYNSIKDKTIRWNVSTEKIVSKSHEKRTATISQSQVITQLKTAANSLVQVNLQVQIFNNGCLSELICGRNIGKHLRLC